MCNRRGAKALLLALLDVLGSGDEEQPDDSDSPKAKRTLLEEYPPGTRPVLPEHRPYGGIMQTGEG